jgi:hypothetical protein
MRGKELARVHARRRRVLSLCCFAALLGLIVLGARPEPAGAEAGGALIAEPVLGATAAGVRTLFGASPGEAPGEVWGAGNSGRGRGDIVRYSEATGWEAMPDPIDAEGNPVSLTANAIPSTASAGQTTVAGGIVAAVSLGSGSSGETQGLIVRSPGGPLQAVAGPVAPVLEEKEKLFSTEASGVKLAAVEEENGETGAFVVPVKSGPAKAVLHYAGGSWTREPICSAVAPAECTTTKGNPSTGFSVVAIGASRGNAWLLAKQLVPSKGEPTAGHVVLLRREEGKWRPQSTEKVTAPAVLGPIGAFFAKETAEPAPGLKVTVAVREKGQPLTVTPTGLWLDASLTAPGETSDATLYYDIEKGEVTGSWCDLQGAAAVMCKGPLGSQLPAGEGRSFAWPGNGGPGEEFGTRAITGVGQGAMLIFENGAFTRIPLDGNGGSSAGAALSAPGEGWLGPSYRLTRLPITSGLQAWPVPFRRPLTAVAPQPGTPVGSLGSQAIAVGDGGQVARYLPGVGWQQEALLTGSGARATPDLRAVAWPEPGFAYAVGNEGAMWMWRATTGLWESDPAAPPNLIRNNFTGIAFDPAEPSRGYAVGKQGLLLGYGKRWTQESLPEGVNPEANITSIAFSGGEAIATYTYPHLEEGNPFPVSEGGIIVNDGSGSKWRVEKEPAELLATVENSETGVGPRRVAGLPDGGAVVVGSTGGVIEREAVGAPWHTVPGGPLGYPAAVAAIREGGQVRAVVSVESNPGVASTSSRENATDEAQALVSPKPGEPPLLTEPYPLPSNGFIVRQTANGWRDEEHQAYPKPEVSANAEGRYDLPRVPDAVLALLLSSEGNEGWAVGGNTGEDGQAETSYVREGVQTAAALRFGADATPPENAQAAPIQVPANAATFAIGGNATCVGPCADMAGTAIGPDVWLRSAVAKAAGIGGVRAFLYTGSSVAPGVAGKLSPSAFGEEEAAYARRLGSAAGALPVYAAPAESDLYKESLSVFAAKFESGFPEPFGRAALPITAGVVAGERAANPAANDSYWFESVGPTGEHRVRVIVLDESPRVPLSSEKKCWLAAQLAAARNSPVPVPAIVVGNREVGAEAELEQILVTGSSALCPLTGTPGAASAYFYQGESERQEQLTWGGASIPAFGTGTLGYGRINNPGFHEHEPASGFLLAAVGEPSPSTGVAPVTVSLIPNIGSLAIDADDGTLLRRSQVALFEALARRPLAGYSCNGSIGAPAVCNGMAPDPYVQIPDRCIRGFKGASCASELLAEYEFSSSNPDIANFVEVDPTSPNPRAVFLQHGKPVPDPKSGLLCAFNAGTTTITVETGGLAYSIPITVQEGSVARPCGTVPLLNKPAVPTKPTVPPPPPPPSPTPHFTQPGGTLPPPTSPVIPTTTPAVTTPSTPPVHHPIHPPAAATLPFFPSPTPAIAPIPVIVPPPPAPAVEPTPPSGTSPVTQPAVSPEPEEEEEAAFDLVHHMAAYRHTRARDAAAVFSESSGGAPSFRYFVPALALLIALAGAGIATPRRRTARLAYEDTRATPRRPLR